MDDRKPTPEELAAEEWKRKTGGATPEEMGEFRHPLARLVDREGRTLMVRRVDVRYTYDGFGAGNPALCSARIRKTLREDLAREYGNGTPIQVVDDLAHPLPGVRVFVEMTCYEPVKSGDLSDLNLCFFMLRKELVMGGILKRAAELVEWDAHAADGEW